MIAGGLTGQCSSQLTTVSPATVSIHLAIPFRLDTMYILQIRIIHRSLSAYPGSSSLSLRYTSHYWLVPVVEGCLRLGLKIFRPDIAVSLVSVPTAVTPVSTAPLLEPGWPLSACEPYSFNCTHNRLAEILEQFHCPAQVHTSLVEDGVYRS